MGCKRRWLQILYDYDVVAFWFTCTCCFSKRCSVARRMDSIRGVIGFIFYLNRAGKRHRRTTARCPTWYPWGSGGFTSKRVQSAFLLQPRQLKHKIVSFRTQPKFDSTRPRQRQTFETSMANNQSISETDSSSEAPKMSCIEESDDAMAKSNS